MIEERGRVVRVQGDLAWVETQRRSACETCSAQNGCGTGLIGRIFKSRSTPVRALNPVRARPGDEIVLGLAEQALVRGALTVYIAPLAALIGGAILADWLAPSGFTRDAVTAIGGLAGLTAGLIWVRRFTRRIRADERYQPVILRCVNTPTHHSNGAWSL